MKCRAGLKYKLESRLLGEISVTSDMQMTPSLWQKVKRNWRVFCWKWEESEKAGLKLNIQKAKLMASGSTTSWQVDGETVQTGKDYFLGLQITADGDCGHKIKRCLLLRRKYMSNLDSMLKSWDINLPTKFHPVKAMVFPLVMCGCESWTIKKAECQRIHAFKLWCGEGSWESLEVQAVNLKGNQCWIFIGRTDAEA